MTLRIVLPVLLVATKAIKKVHVQKNRDLAPPHVIVFKEKLVSIRSVPKVPRQYIAVIKLVV